jgi:hypothetical protein
MKKNTHSLFQISPPSAVFWVSLLKEPCEKTREENAVMEGVEMSTMALLILMVMPLC